MILFNGQQIPITEFPNGESNIPKPFFGKIYDPKGKNTITLKYENDSDLFRLLLIRKSLWFDAELHIPYFPYSRMDRNSDSHIFTLKSVTKFINWLDFVKVHVYEPHSDVTPALLNHCKIHSVTPELLKKTDYNKEVDYVLYPDTGAYKKYADVIKSPYELVGIKHRDFATGRIKELQIVKTQTGHYIKVVDKRRCFIVDDLCSKGGTFIMAAEELKDMGFAEINLVVAHCEPTIWQGELLKNSLIENIYTTDSIIDKSEAKKTLNLHIFPLTDIV